MNEGKNRIIHLTHIHFLQLTSTDDNIKLRTIRGNVKKGETGYHHSLKTAAAIAP
jgi:hypothetical protein